jgi:hypothetical protein
MSTTLNRGTRTLRLALAGLSVGMALVAAPAAHAEFGIQPGTFIATALDDNGQVLTQAGAHPNATTGFALNTTLNPIGSVVPDEDVRDVRVELPPGVLGDPTAMPKCRFDELSANVGCPVATQVGLATLVHRPYEDAPEVLETQRVYNLQPERGKTAQFGFRYGRNNVVIDAQVRTDGDYGITAVVKDLPGGLLLLASKLTLWGVPADTVHDFDRYPFGGRGAGVLPQAFFSNPTSCGVVPTTRISVRSWQNPDRWVSADPVVSPAPTGCDKLVFSPAATALPSTTAPDAPSGLDVDLTFPEPESPVGLSTPPLRDARVTLPEGMTINPGSAAGLQACSDTQLGLKSKLPSTCPEAAKIGTVEATTPVLEEPLTGGVYLRTQNSDDPASGEMFRMALVLENADRGLRIKLPGAVRVDPATGRIVTEFTNNPQVPVSKISLKLKSGPRAPLATPASCGTKTVDGHLTSWGGQVADVQAPSTIDCAAGLGSFAPTLSAGVTNPVGGGFSPFAVSIAKPDGNTPIDGLSMTLPTGLVAQLKGNVGQQVGRVTAFAGPGSNPFALPGRVYLEGAYGDAPFSLKVVVPAKAGPFDLGEVVVRQKIYVNPETTQVTVVSDPIPTIVKGVPVRLQRLDVDVDKPGFMINPTSCAAKEIKGTLTSVAGQTAALTNRFQVGDCASLGFTPKLAMSMSGKGQTKDGSHPALHARLTPPVGDANSKQTTVTLPLSLALDPGNANGLCEPKDAAANTCPANSIVGSAQAQSILPDTLKGPVYFVRGERIDSKGKVRKTLPKLFIPLSANGVTVNVHASSDVQGERLVTTFDNLPDAPFNTFDLNINGGKHGILAVSSANTCAATQIADAEFGGQNGKAYTSKVTMGTPCALGIVKSSHTSTALKVTVGGLGAGKVSASGDGVTKSSRSLTSATTAALSLKLSKVTRRALARGRDVKVKVKVAFTPKGVKKAKTATKTVVIHGAKKR